MKPLNRGWARLVRKAHGRFPVEQPGIILPFHFVDLLAEGLLGHKKLSGRLCEV